MARWGLVAAHGVTSYGYDDFEPRRACVTARRKRGQSACGVYLPDLEQPRPPEVKLRLVKKNLGKGRFGNWFSKAARATGVKKSAHGLRKVDATAVSGSGVGRHRTDPRRGCSRAGFAASVAMTALKRMHGMVAGSE